ncbi:MAG: hypothetical protein AAGF47_06855 [Planctomycetota bacterium]
MSFRQRILDDYRFRPSFGIFDRLGRDRRLARADEERSFRIWLGILRPEPSRSEPDDGYAVLEVCWEHTIALRIRGARATRGWRDSQDGGGS